MGEASLMQSKVGDCRLELRSCRWRGGVQLAALWRGACGAVPGTELLLGTYKVGAYSRR